MLSFIHTYTADTVDGLFRQGLFRKGDGLKMMHKSYLPSEYQFNEMGAVGGNLYNTLKSLRCPFYIDRFQGGIGLPWHYNYSPELVEEYRRLLGDNFWGWQMHEWASNYNSDRVRVIEAYEKYGVADGSRSKESFWADVISEKIALFLEALTREEWSKNRIPQNRAEFIADIYELYRLRMEMTGGQLIPADSFYMAPKIELAAGTRLLLPEVGWQIPNMRLQLAYYRGMAKAYSARLGVYYECWGWTEGYGLTIPYSLREGQDEWIENQLTTGSGADRSFEERENGGSSRNLQARIFRYAYLAGATAIGEEYGVCNTFRNLGDFELSIYGQVKKKFLNFTEELPCPGKTYTPIAIVLPENLPVLDVVLRDNYIDYPEIDGSYPLPADTWKQITQTLGPIFGETGSHGNMSHVIKNGGLPDVFDIIHADTPGLDKYEYLIDLTGDSVFAAKHKNIVKPEEVSQIFDTLLPCRIDERLHAIYNRTEDGWLVGIFNNDGVQYDNFKGDIFFSEADIRTEIKLNGYKIISVMNGDIEHSEGRFFLDMPAGSWKIVKLAKE